MRALPIYIGLRLPETAFLFPFNLSRFWSNLFPGVHGMHDAMRARIKLPEY